MHKQYQYTRESVDVFTLGFCTSTRSLSDVNGFPVLTPCVLRLGMRTTIQVFETPAGSAMPSESYRVFCGIGASYSKLQNISESDDEPG